MEIQIVNRLKTKEVIAILTLTQGTGFFPEHEIAVLETICKDFNKGGSEKSGYYFLLATENGEILGFTCFGPNPVSTHSWDLYWIVVKHRKQGKGIGKNLMLESFRIAKENRGGLIWIETSGRELYAPTWKFYENCGCTKSATLKDFYAPGDDKIIYCYNNY